MEQLKDRALTEYILYFENGDIRRMRGKLSELQKLPVTKIEPVTTLTVVCMYCKSFMGEKDGQGQTGTSHSICRSCWMEKFPEYPYPEDEKECSG